MKHIKTFEAVRSKNLIIGEIYKIEQIIIAEKGESNMNLGQIIDIEDGITFLQPYHFKVKTYLNKTGDEYIFKSLERMFIERKATPEEIEEFHIWELNIEANKYNL